MAEALGVPATDISYGAAYKEYCKRNDTYIEDKKKNQRLSNEKQDRHINWLM